MSNPTRKPQNWPIIVKKGSMSVRIYHTPENGRDRFTIEWREAGVRRRVTRVDLAEARELAKETAGRLSGGLGAGLVLSGAEREAYQHALKALKPSGLSLSVAVDEFMKARSFDVPVVEAAKAYAATHNAKLPSRTVAEIVGELLSAKKADGASKAYLHALKSYLSAFSRDFKGNIADVQTADIDAWLRALKLSPRSRNNFRNYVALLFSFAQRAGYLDPDKKNAGERTSTARRKETEIEIFTPAEMASLLASADDVARPFLVLGGFVGLRSAEILRLTWTDINWPEKVVEIRAGVSKTKTRRLPPLTDAACAWLESYKGSKGVIIPSLDKLRQALERASDDSGVAWKKNGLRHAYGTYRIAVLKDPVRVSYEMGNSAQVIRQSYDRVVPERTGRAWFAILPTAPGNIVAMPTAGAA
jgi:integrase